MGKIRQRAGRAACGECLAPAYEPCVSKTTHRPIGGFHRSRLWLGKCEHLNREVARIEGDEAMDSFWQFCWVALGLAEKNYPEKTTPESWQAIYETHPIYDPGQAYFGEW